MLQRNVEKNDIFYYKWVVHVCGHNQFTRRRRKKHIRKFCCCFRTVIHRHRPHNCTFLLHGEHVCVCVCSVRLQIFALFGIEKCTINPLEIGKQREDLWYRADIRTELAEVWFWLLFIIYLLKIYLCLYQITGLLTKLHVPNNHCWKTRLHVWNTLPICTKHRLKQKGLHQ